MSKIIPGLFALLLITVPALAGTEPTATSSDDLAADAPRLWAQTCQQCHNLRPVKNYSAVQWGVIMHHMREKAYLTGSQAREIAAFLQQANSTKDTK